jgi:DNA polymerase V
VKALKRQVEQVVGIPVSVGVSSSKTRAKYVNSVAKKTGGIAVWDNARFEEETPKIRLSEIWGVGRERTKAFTEKGIITVFDLLMTDKAMVAKLYGVEGVRLKAELNGLSVLKLKRVQEPQKSITSSRSFGETTTDFEVLEDAVMYHLYQGVLDLENMNMLATALQVMISPSRFGDYALQGSSRAVVLNTPTRDLFVLQKAAKDLLEACYRPEVPYKKAGVLLSGLVSPLSTTASLFGADNERISDSNLLSKTVFDINKKLGKSIIQLGRIESDTSAWFSKSETLSPSYTTNWSELKVVQAK